MSTAQATQVTEYKNYINGKWVVSSGTKLADNINPATGEVIGRVRLSTRDEARAAVESARAAFPAWSALPAPKRAEYLWNLQRVMERRKQELGEMLTREEGKILRESLGEVQKALNIIEFIAGEGRRIGGVTRPSEMANTFCYTTRVPLGVVSLITPWNFPVAIPIWKIAPAILAGNTCVFKPATITPATAVMIMEMLDEVKLPAGVVNLVLGSGSEVGDELVQNKHIRAVSFTGSNEVGCKLYADAARRHIKVQCEMGGKNPIVILDDADLELAAESTAQGAFGSTGQRCTATSRVVIDNKVADRFVDLLRKKAEAVVIGDGLQGNVSMGPSVDEGQMKKVLEYIEIGKNEDKARLVIGGARATSNGLDKGFFVQPTIFDHVSRTMRIAQEEIFGPVISIVRVNSVDEAIEVANDVEYGLTSSVYTNDINRVFKFIDKIETGITHVNSPTMGGEAQLPFGGMKATGVGSREMNEEAFDFFTEIKTVYVDYTGQKRDTNVY
jgi:aldehyde dehydrogenase (NAD+)